MRRGCSWGVAPDGNDNGPLALNRAISTMQVIEELIELAKEMSATNQRGVEVVRLFKGKKIPSKQ
jgi:hypothetical protein